MTYNATYNANLNYFIDQGYPLQQAEALAAYGGPVPMSPSTR
jgi:hypothetical protein